MALLGALTVLLMKSHEHAPTLEQVVFIRLKRLIYNKIVRLREFGEPEHLYLWNTCVEHCTSKTHRNK